MALDNRDDNTFKALPQEVLVRIFDFFTTHVEFEEKLHQASEAESFPDYLTLSHITKASRHFYRLAQPLLYRVLLLHERATCALLLRTLLNRPKIGRLVNSLSIHVYDDEFDPETDEVLRENRHLLQNVVENSKEPPKLPETGCAQLALFLAFLPSLEFLDAMLDDKHGLSSDFLTKIPYWRAVIGGQQPTSKKSPPTLAIGAESPTPVCEHFPDLQQVRLRHWRLLNKTPRLQYAADLFTLPSLESLHCHWTNLSLTPSQINHLSTSTNPFNLQSLYLENSSIDSPSLSTILSHSPKLRSLVLSWGEDHSPDTKITYSQIGAHLRAHSSHTLETLILNPPRSRTGVLREAGDENSNIGNLSSLTHLRRLAIDSNALLGLSLRNSPAPPTTSTTSSVTTSESPHPLSRILPPSLEILHLSFPIGAVKTGEKALYQLLESTSRNTTRTTSTIPDLQQVSVDDRNVKFRKDFESLGWTRAGLREVGDEMAYYGSCFFPMLTRDVGKVVEDGCKA